MTAVERALLVRQLYETEIQYLEIRQRADVLQALPSRTAQQDAALSDYLKKLQHDRDIVGIWASALSADGVANPRALVDRDTVMEELRQRALDQEAQQLAELTDIERLGKQPGQTDAEHNTAIAALRTKIQDRRAKLAALITELKADTRYAWQR